MSGSSASDLVGSSSDRQKLIAVVYADMAGYSRLIGADDAGTFARLQELRRDLIDPALARNAGTLVNTAGDSLLVAFDSIISAMRFAVEVQRNVPKFDGDHAPDRRIRFRMGVNVGDVIPDGTNMHGDGVNVAARLQTVCPPGAICVSRVVRDQVGNRLGLPFKELGAIELKNIGRPVEAFVLELESTSSAATAASIPARAPPARSRLFFAAIAAIGLIAAGALVWGMRSHQAAPGIATGPSTGPAGRPAEPLSIVVLPFTNLSGDAAQEYFTDSITDDLTTDLSRISGSVVIAHSTADTFKGKAIDVRKIGQELGVRYVLEGSVRMLGDHVEVNAQLIDAASETHVWAERFDTDRRNIAQAQNEITGRLARTLNLELVADASRRIVQSTGTDPNARDLIMRGWALWYKPLSAATHEQALRAFNEALALDPQSVDARIGVATILVTNVGLGLSRTAAQDEVRAEQLLLEAVERDPNNSSAHQVLGILRRIQNRLDEAVVQFEASVSLDRNNAHSLLQLGQVMMFLGRPAAAIPYIQSSERLDPRDPNAAFGDWALGTCYLLLGDLEPATALLRKAGADNPRIYFFQLYLAGALGLRGDLDEGRAALAAAIKLDPTVTSLARWRTAQPWTANPQFWALREKTLNVGLRRVGMPDE